MIFFKPSNKFLDWLYNYADGRIIYDVGCGDGYLLSRMIKRGMKCIGIEPFPSQRAHIKFFNCLVPVFSEDYFGRNCVKNSVVLFCRPCHDGFVQRTIDLIDDSNKVLYISKPENVKIDLKSGVTELTRVGCKEEVVYYVSL